MRNHVQKVYKYWISGREKINSINIVVVTDKRRYGFHINNKMIINRTPTATSAYIRRARVYIHRLVTSARDADIVCECV
jgi:hypothetical protein